MKTTVDIPDDLLEDAMKFAGTKVKRSAIVTAVADYNRRHRISALSRHLGTCKNLITLDELKQMRATD